MPTAIKRFSIISGLPIAGAMFIAGLIAATLLPAAVSADTAIAGFSGKVVSVNASANSFSGEVRAVYAGGGGAGVGGVLPPGKTVQVQVPPGTPLTNVRGLPITLAEVQAGVFFNATVKIDTVSKTVTASKVQFGGRIAPLPTPTPSPSPNPSPSPTPSGSPGPTPTSTPAPQTATVNFAGKIDSIDAATRVAQVTVRAVYGGTGGARFGALLPPGTRITLTVPAGIPITRLGVPITLDDVKAGDVFNARATINRAAKTGVASSIQVITPRITENIFTGTLTAFSAVDPKSVTVKDKAGTEQVFSIIPTTQVYIGKVRGALDQLIVGRSVAVAFVTTGGTKQAVKVVMATEQLQVRVDKFFAMDAVAKRGERGVQVLGASLNRLDKIIAKQEAVINDLKTQGKDTANAESLLAQSKRDLAAARTSLDDTRAKVAAISTASDPKAAAEAARTSMRVTSAATKKVAQDVKNTQAEIKRVSQ